MFGDYVEAEAKSEKSWFRRVVLPVVAVTLTAFAIGAYIAHRHAQNVAAELSAHGVRADARFDNRYVYRRKGASSHYEVSYTYYVNGRRYSGTQYVDSQPARFETSVVYLPNDPRVHRLDDPELPDDETSWGEIAATLLIGAIVSFVGWLWSAFVQVLGGVGRSILGGRKSG